MKQKILLEILRHLKPAGTEGFEGLIAKLLGALTGISFTLAASGTQHGKDMIASSDNGIHIAVECKKYSERTSLDLTELLGKISEAYHQTPNLDVWTLVSTKPLNSQLYERLRDEEELRGLKISIIETGDGEPSSLEVLCASSYDTLVNHIKENPPENIEPDWSKKVSLELKNIRDHFRYEAVLSKLKHNFEKEEIGYYSWKDKQNGWLKKSLCSETASRGAFGQVICIDDTFIERVSVSRELNNWINNWYQEKSHFVLLGEEGDGKTWAMASWISNYIDIQNELPVLFLNSKSIESTNIVDILARAINRQLKKHSTQYWERKINNWQSRNHESKPLFILIIDGLNENHVFNWRELFEKIREDKWDEKVALAFITRSKHWEIAFGNLKHLKMKKFTLAPFDDSELKTAMKKRDLTIEDISDSLRPLARKPRYLDLIVKHRRQMENSGDITVQRLLYEDFKDRIARKNHKNLTDRDFSEIMMELAEKFRVSGNLFSRKDLPDIGPLKQQKNIYMELLTSGVFIDHPIRASKFIVEPKRLAHGLGLILLEEMYILPTKNESTLEECISKYLEPQPGIDFKSDIIDSAVFHAMNLPNTPESIGIALLTYWSTSSNINASYEKDIQAYFPCNPQIYFSFTESVYLQGESWNLRWAKISLEDTFTYWIENSEQLRDTIKSKFEEWMGYIFIESREKIHHDWKEQKQKDEIRQKIGIIPSSGKFNFQGYPLTCVEEHNLLGLCSMVLSIISRSCQKTFLRAITLGCLTDEIMSSYHRFPKCLWILRINHESFWPHIKDEIKTLLSKDNPITNLTAHVLLTFEGSTQAIEFRSELIGKEIFGIGIYSKKFEKKYSQNIRCTRENYPEFVLRQDIHPERVVRELSHLALEPDLPEPPGLKGKLKDILDTLNINALWVRRGFSSEDFFIKVAESTLYAFYPHYYSNLINSIIRNAENGECGILGLWTYHLREHFLIIGKQEYELIKRAWLEIFEKKELSEFEKQNESILFPLVLINLPAEQQFSYLINRNEDLTDLYSFDDFFKPLHETSMEYVLDTIDLIKYTKKPWRISSFLAKHPAQLAPEVLNKIGELFDSESCTARGAAFEIAARSEDKNLIEKFLDSNWRYQEQSSNEDYGMRMEKHWGCSMLFYFGVDRPFSEIKRRICPSFLGETIMRRGERREEIEECVNDLFVNKSYLLENSCCEIQNGNKENYRESQDDCRKDIPLDNVQIQSDLLKYVYQLFPDYLDKILRKVLQESPKTDQLIYHDSFFYKELCSVLLKYNSQKGVMLYHRIKLVKGARRLVDTNTGIEILTYNLFRTKRTPELARVWKSELDNCFTDYSLFEIALVNQKVDNRLWLKEQINQKLDSNILFEKGRGIILLGFLDTHDETNVLDTILTGMPESWLREVVKVAIEKWRYNKWAKTWFSRFVEADNDIKAWAFFRLFLKCVDRRYWLWKDEVLKKSMKSYYREKRENFYKLNRDKIKDRIKENEKKLKENFLGTKIEKGIWPWL